MNLFILNKNEPLRKEKGMPGNPPEETISSHLCWQLFYSTKSKNISVREDLPEKTEGESELPGQNNIEGLPSVTTSYALILQNTA